MRLRSAVRIEIGGTLVSCEVHVLGPMSWLCVWTFHPMEDTGKEPIFLQHGLGGSVLMMIRLIRYYVQLGHTVIVEEMPGHGWSSTPMTWLDGAKMLADVTYECANGRPAIIVGHSLGGLYAKEMAVRWPGIVGALMTLNTPEQDMGVIKIMGGLLTVGGDVTRGLARAGHQSWYVGDTLELAAGVARMMSPLPPRVLPLAPWMLKRALRNQQGALADIEAQSLPYLLGWGLRDRAVQPARERPANRMLDTDHCGAVLYREVVPITGRHTGELLELVHARAA